MFRRSLTSRTAAGVAGPNHDFQNWPWPRKLPLKAHWYRHLSTGPEQSISQEVRRIQTAGDFAVCATVGFIFYRLYKNIVTDTYKTRLSHTTGMPPALVAQDVNFADASANRRVERKVLDQYREEFGNSRGEQIEKFIFKY
jgi:hypothetical protein